MSKVSRRGQDVGGDKMLEGTRCWRGPDVGGDKGTCRGLVVVKVGQETLFQIVFAIMPICNLQVLSKIWFVHYGSKI
jgi:hypothetical protein